MRYCLVGTVKRTPEEIQAAVCGRLDNPEKVLLKILLNKVETATRDTEEILELMKQLSEPYKTALSQMDSIPGIDITSALLILSEIGAQPHENFNCPERLCSWAGLSPRNDESAGKIKSRKTLHGNPYIKSILCQVAWASVKTKKNPFGQWFWSHQGKLGRKKAIIAVSRKILTLIYHLIQNNSFYDPVIAMKPYTVART